MVGLNSIHNIACIKTAIVTCTYFIEHLEYVVENILNLKLRMKHMFVLHRDIYRVSIRNSFFSFSLISKNGKHINIFGFVCLLLLNI